jgi:23S rRNA (uracil1939-C5)-methyltransferase
MVRNDVLSLDVERPAVGGAMIARSNGQVVLVTGAVPGERVQARIDRVGRGVAFATTVAVEQASPDRRSPFGDPACGGCLYSHIAYERQLAIKSLVIADAFARIGRLEVPAAIPVAASREDGYRMRARLHVRGGRLGFFREGTHEICDPRQSRQLLPETCDALERLMASARSLGDVVREVELSENMAAAERVVYLETTGPVDRRALDAMTGGDGFTPAPYVTDRFESFTLRRHVLAFFQGNRYLIRDLVAYVAAQLPAGGRVLDLYAGAGLFSVAAAAKGAMVTAVEGDRFAADDLALNAAQELGAHGTTAGPRGAVIAMRSDVESFLARGAMGAGAHGPAIRRRHRRSAAHGAVTSGG